MVIDEDTEVDIEPEVATEEYEESDATSLHAGKGEEA